MHGELRGMCASRIDPSFRVKLHDGGREAQTTIRCELFRESMYVSGFSVCGGVCDRLN